MNLAYKYPIIFWNCACLIADSGGAKSDEDEDEIENGDVDDFVEEIYYDDSVEEFGGEEEEDDEDDEEEVTTKKEKKKKKKANNYGKIASAIGKMQAAGIDIKPPNINSSAYTFSPDAKNDIIRHGLSGITRIGDDIVKNIMQERPFDSLTDFLKKVKVSKPQMVNLIKSGAFDTFESSRAEVMKQYIKSVSDQKKRVTLQNMKMLIDFKLLPESLSFECRVFNFNKYLKKFKYEKYYLLDNIAFEFYNNNFDVDNLAPADSESGFMIQQDKWENIYQKNMDKIRPYIKSNHDELLEKINNRLIFDLWDKYCKGSISKWEMDSISHYNHPHELISINNKLNGLSDFEELPNEPIIDRIIYIKGRQIPLYELNRIAGTVLDKDKLKNTVTLLTTTGVVTVKIFGGAFSNYDKQISRIGADGKKHVIEKSWFSRGNKIIVTGIKRESMFFAKKYSQTPYHLVELITSVGNNGLYESQETRTEEEE